MNLDSRSYAAFSTKPKDRVRRSKLIAKYGLTEGIARFAQGETAYARRTVEVVDGFPIFLAELRIKVAAFAGRQIHEFQQGGVNEYPPGAGIGWHKDKPEFGAIVGVSLLSPATMRLRLSTGKTWDRKSQELKPRSIYILDGDARTRWEHSVIPVNSLRYSLTFRTLARHPKEDEKKAATDVKSTAS